MNFDFIKTIDFLFKIHKIFNLKFHGALLQLMLVIQNYIFGFKENQNLLTTNSLKMTKKIF